MQHAISCGLVEDGAGIIGKATSGGNLNKVCAILLKRLGTERTATLTQKIRDLGGIMMAGLCSGSNVAWFSELYGERHMPYGTILHLELRF